MGSSVSLLFADMILEILEDEVISKRVFKLGFKLPFFWHYVDDILTAVTSDKVDDIKVAFNKYNKHIQFTMVKECNERTSFLKVMCLRVGRAIKTNWFYKDT